MNLGLITRSQALNLNSDYVHYIESILMARDKLFGGFRGRQNDLHVNDFVLTQHRDNRKQFIIAKVTEKKYYGGDIPFFSVTDGEGLPWDIHQKCAKMNIDLNTSLKDIETISINNSNLSF